MTTDVIGPTSQVNPATNPEVTPEAGNIKAPKEAAAAKPAPSRDRNIYAVVDIAPETQAYALARYSRSAASLRESVGWISNQKAADFLETFYFAYGHKSIADMAHITLALENISVLAAVVIEDEPLWDGQERSTRYQDFSKSRYVVPGELESQPENRETFTAAADYLFATYNALTKELYGHLAEALPRPDDMDPAAYKRTLNARILDVTRTLLPYATRTSVGQITSARVLERQLSRLLASPYQEIRAIASEMKEVCKQPGFSPLEIRLQASLENLVAQHPEAAGPLKELAGVFSATEPAPTLVKYAEPSPQQAQAAAGLSQAARELLRGIEPDNSRTVHLVEGTPPLLEAVTTLLYRYSDLAYHQVQAVVLELSPAQVNEIYDLAHAARGRHDGWLREQQSGYGRIYDILIDAKSMQDFFRHRRCVQVRQEITPRHGFVGGKEWFELGLPAQTVASALDGGQVERYDRTMRETAQVVSRLEAEAAHYLLPLGFKRRALFKMDDAQAAYMIETRSGVNGHFAYRQAAYQMWQELERVQPEVARWVRVTPFEQSDFLNR
ncbi:MAG: alternative thymidylate synthase-like protein [Chloroflexi bacterium]|jgi:thymidylate synthase ThyX|nr:alternative thymidylate synthase-like protein [Chloroflexota bacterium]